MYKNRWRYWYVYIYLSNYVYSLACHEGIFMSENVSYEHFSRLTRVYSRRKTSHMNVFLAASTITCQNVYIHVINLHFLKTGKSHKKNVPLNFCISEKNTGLHKFSKFDGFVIGFLHISCLKTQTSKFEQIFSAHDGIFTSENEACEHFSLLTRVYIFTSENESYERFSWHTRIYSCLTASYTNVFLASWGYRPVSEQPNSFTSIRHIWELKFLAIFSRSNSQ